MTRLQAKASPTIVGAMQLERCHAMPIRCPDFNSMLPLRYLYTYKNRPHAQHTGVCPATTDRL